MKNISISNKIQALTQSKPAAWSDEEWSAYNFGTKRAKEVLGFFGTDMSYRDVLASSWELDHLSDHWKEKAVSQSEHGLDYDGTMSWYVVMGVDDVKDILIDTLDEYLAQLEGQA